MSASRQAVSQAPPRAASQGRARILPHLAAVVVAAVVFALVYDPFHAGSLAFLALAPVALVFLDPRLPCSLPRAALCGFAFGLTAAMGIVGPWMYSASADYFGRSGAWSLAFTLAVNAVYVALFYAPAFVALRLLATSSPVRRAIGAASVWIAFEALRAGDLLGNGWALLGQGLYRIPLMREAAAYGGVSTLGWAAALSGAALGVALQPGLEKREMRRCFTLAAAGPLLLVLLGASARLTDGAPAPMEPLRVAVVQAEIASRDMWDPAQRMANWDAYFTQTASLDPGTIDLVVWPENAVPFLLDADAGARARLGDLASRLDAAIMLGAPRSAVTGEGRAALFNSVYFFAPHAEGALTYDKRRLLPFVEAIPATWNAEAAPADYAAGDSAAWFQVRGWRISPLLCFEAVYPQYAREAVLGGADLLVNLSNDAWFSGGAGPEQHYAMSVWRTVELRRPMVRASNGGISGAIGSDGEPLGPLIRRERALRSYEIPPPSTTRTFTASTGNLSAWLAGGVALFALASALRGHRNRF